MDKKKLSQELAVKLNDNYEYRIIGRTVRDSGSDGKIFLQSERDEYVLKAFDTTYHLLSSILSEKKVLSFFPDAYKTSTTKTNTVMLSDSFPVDVSYGDTSDDILQYINPKQYLQAKAKKGFEDNEFWTIIDGKLIINSKVNAQQNPFIITALQNTVNIDIASSSLYSIVLNLSLSDALMDLNIYDKSNAYSKRAYDEIQLLSDIRQEQNRSQAKEQ